MGLEIEIDWYSQPRIIKDLRLFRAHSHLLLKLSEWRSHEQASFVGVSAKYSVSKLRELLSPVRAQAIADCHTSVSSSKSQYNVHLKLFSGYVCDLNTCEMEAGGLLA